MNEKVLRIAICDDDKTEQQSLYGLVEDFMERNEIVCKTDVFSSGEQMLEGDVSVYSLFFLDIFMGELNGITTAERIRKKNVSAGIVFCSTSNEFAAESYNVSAFYYMIKPVSTEKINTVLERFLRDELKSRSISVKVGRDTEVVLLPDIIYAEAQSKKTLIHTVNGEISVSSSLSQLEEMLPHDSFVKPIRYAVVSMDKIARTPSDTIVLCDGSEIPISRNVRREVKDRFVRYKLSSLRRRETK